MAWSSPEKRRAWVNKRNMERRNGAPPKPNIRKAASLICPQCGKEFYRSPSNRSEYGGRGKVDYCSRACMATAFEGRFVGEKSPRWKGEVVRPCENCGKEVIRPIWTVGKNKKTFCDSNCFGEWKSRNWTGEDNPCWRGGHPPYYGANWIRQQREARYRDGHKCQICGIDESECRRSLDVHHIIPFRFFAIEQFKKANALSNLISVCPTCHGYAEQVSKSGTVTSRADLLSAVTRLRQDQTMTERYTPSLVAEDS